MPISDMLEQRNKRLAFFLVMLIVVLTVLVMVNSAERREVDKAFYRKTDLKQVDRVTLETHKGTTELVFTKNRWRLADGAPADRNLVEVLFATLQQAEPKRPVAGSQKDSIALILKTSGVNVTLYREGAVEEQFFAGGNSSKTQAYFYKESADAPHLVVIPGYRVYVSGIFELPPHQWREKLIFDFNWWRNFKSLEVRFRNPAGDFDVVMDRNVVEIKGLPQADTAKLNTFLDELSLFTVEEYLDSGALADSTIQTGPIASFKVRDIGDRTFELKIYTRQREFIGHLNDDLVAILPEQRLRQILRPKEYFIKR